MKNIRKISLLIIIIASYQTAYCSEKISRSGSPVALHSNLEPSSSVTVDESVFYEVSSQASFESAESSPFDPLNPNHIRAHHSPAIQADEDCNASLSIEEMIKKQVNNLAMNCYAHNISHIHGKWDDLYCRFELSQSPFKVSEELDVPTGSIKSTELATQNIKQEAATPTLQSADKKNSAYFTATNGLISATIVASAVTGYWLMRKK